MNLRWAAMAALMLSTTTLAEEPRGPLAPKDECAQLPGFAAFDAALKAAVAARDIEALMALTADEVLLDFGGGAGKDLWRKRLAVSEYNSWEDIAGTIALGCAGSPGEPGTDGEGTPASAAYPWYWSSNQGEIDPYAAQLVTGTDVLLRAGPSREDRVIGRVSWDWVEGDYEEPVNGYRRVTTQDSRTGFIAARYLRSMIDYRLLAEHGEEGWRITHFIAGD